jgi:hypothetical protein
MEGRYGSAHTRGRTEAGDGLIEIGIFKVSGQGQIKEAPAEAFSGLSAFLPFALEGLSQCYAAPHPSTSNRLRRVLLDQARHQRGPAGLVVGA